METNVTYQRRLSGEKPIDFRTMIFCLSSENVDYTHLWKGLIREMSTHRFFVGGLMANKRKAEKMERNVEYRRKLRSHTKISSVSSDGVSSDLKAASGSSRPRRRSRRPNKTASLLRGPLNDSLFDYCFQNIWSESSEEKRKPCAYFSCFLFYMYSMEHNRERVLSWIKKDNIFSKKYVFLPIVLWSHWSLLIFCHLGESLGSETKTPCMLLLDSLHTLDPLRLEPLIRSLILDIYRTEGRPETNDMVQNIPLLVPKVPQQRNGEECGIFVLYYINLFLENAPENFSVSRGYPYFMKEEWFTEVELERFYKKLESFGPEPSDHELSDPEPGDVERCDDPEPGDVERCDDPEPGDIERCDDPEPGDIERNDPEQ